MTTVMARGNRPFEDAVAAIAGPVAEAKYTGRSLDEILDDVGHIDRQMALAALSGPRQASRTRSGGRS
jgi:hypothetical protein